MSQSYPNLQVRNLDSTLTFISDSQDAQEVKDFIGKRAEVYDSFFVRIDEGDYEEVWGMYGIVPNLDRWVYKLK